MSRPHVYTGGVTRDRIILARIADRQLTLAEVAEELGYRTYGAFAAACRRLFGARPREIREGRAFVGSEVAQRQTATAQYHLRCTPWEHEEITRLAGALAQRDGVTRGAALVGAMADALRPRGKASRRPRSDRGRRG